MKKEGNFSESSTCSKELALLLALLTGRVSPSHRFNQHAVREWWLTALDLIKNKKGDVWPKCHRQGTTPALIEERGVQKTKRNWMRWSMIKWTCEQTTAATGNRTCIFPAVRHSGSASAICYVETCPMVRSRDEVKSFSDVRFLACCNDVSGNKILIRPHRLACLLRPLARLPTGRSFSKLIQLRKGQCLAEMP